MKEAGVEGVEVPVWYALLAPAATPREVVASAGRRHGARRPRARHQADAWSSKAPTPSATRRRNSAKLLRAEVVKYAEIVRISGAKPE